MGFKQPHLVIFQNDDGTWGENGELDYYLSYLRDPNKVFELGSSSNPTAQKQWQAEANFYKEKFERCVNVMEELRKMHRTAADKLDTGIFDAYRGLAQSGDVLRTIPCRENDQNGCGTTVDGQLRADASHVQGKRTASRMGKAGRPLDSNTRRYRVP